MTLALIILIAESMAAGVIIGVNLLLDDADFVSAVLLAVYAVFIILTAYVIYNVIYTI